MMKFGVNTFVWVSPCTTQAAEELAPKVKSLGFDIFEMACENPGLIDVQAVKKTLKAERPGRNCLRRFRAGQEYLQ